MFKFLLSILLLSSVRQAHSWYFERYYTSSTCTNNNSSSSYFDLYYPVVAEEGLGQCFKPYGSSSGSRLALCNYDELSVIYDYSSDNCRGDRTSTLDIACRSSGNNYYTQGCSYQFPQVKDGDVITASFPAVFNSPCQGPASQVRINYGVGCSGVTDNSCNNGTARNNSTSSSGTSNSNMSASNNTMSNNTTSSSTILFLPSVPVNSSRTFCGNTFQQSYVGYGDVAAYNSSYVHSYSILLLLLATIFLFA